MSDGGTRVCAVRRGVGPCQQNGWGDPVANVKGEAFLTERELAERWRCATGWLANMRSQGVGPRYHKLNRLVRYALADVTAYEAARAVKIGA